MAAGWTVSGPGDHPDFLRDFPNPWLEKGFRGPKVFR
jgi:hypothetical protein